MRIAVFSDSHGDLRQMRRVTAAQKPDTVFHLGDYTADAEALHDLFPEIPLYSVAGNNDYRAAVPLTLTLEMEGVKLILTHGHTFGVHAGCERLLHYALEQNARAALFGHTHSAFCEEREGVWLLNPGRAADGWLSMSPASCGILTLEQGSLAWEPVNMENA